MTRPHRSPESSILASPIVTVTYPPLLQPSAHWPAKAKATLTAPFSFSLSFLHNPHMEAVVGRGMAPTKIVHVTSLGDCEHALT